MKKILLCVLAALFCLMAAPVHGAGDAAGAAPEDAVASLEAASDQDVVNREIYSKVAAAVAGKTDLPMSDLTVQVALSMLGTPYVGGTLEGDKEELRIFLDKTDCILFVESCVCMALTFKGLSVVQGDAPDAVPAGPSYELFCDNVRAMRYRDGVVDGYASRLHYTSEWILQAQRNGVMKEYTEVLGVPREQNFSFMTAHLDLYPSLKSDPSQTAIVRAAEQRLDAAGPYFYVPQAKLVEASSIRSGDIIFIISGAAGLDISHVAIAYEHDGAMHFIHASSKAGRVIIEPRTLAAYATRGIRLARLLP